MKIITLTENEFTKFTYHHKYHNFYQTISYAKVMKTEGYDFKLLGFTNNSNKLIGATMILIKKVFMKYKVAYSPYGFLIDYSDFDFIEELTYKLKLLLMKQHIIYLKINPNIQCSNRDIKGNIVSYNPQINDTLEILQKNGYIYRGFNNYFENKMPRWNAILKLTSSNNNLYKDFNKQTRNKIQKAIRLGVEVIVGTENDLPVLYEFIKRKHNKNLKYYRSIMNEFGSDAKIYLAKLNTKKYISSSNELYEKELNINEMYNQKLQKLNINNKEYKKLINKKMESDRKLATIQKNIIQATELSSKYPEGVVIGGVLIIKYQKEISMIIEGFNKNYRDFNPNYLLKWEIIKNANKDGYLLFNLNGIVGEFKKINKYTGLNEMKLGYNASAIEYIGEFDLITNKTVYWLYQKGLGKRRKAF